MTDRLALAAAVLAGLLLTVQARVNGALAASLGSAVVAALASFTVGTVAVTAAVLGSASARAAARRRPSERVRPHWWLGGLGGASVVGISAYAVSRTGVALLTVLIVAGSTAGALLVDRAGLGPGGVRPVTTARVAGAGLAVAAVVLSAAGHVGAVGPLVLVAAVLAGAAVSAQQAVNGQLARVSGSPRVAAVVSFVVGTSALALVVAGLAAAGRLGPVALSAPWWQWTGGLSGALFIIVAAAVFGRLGSLRLTLATVAGQLTGAVLLDALVPPPGQRLRAATVVAGVLTLVAVRVAGRQPVTAGRP